MKNYQVWLKARDPRSLEVVASVRVFNHADRLEAERAMETAQARLQLLVLQLLHVHPGALISTEMEMPGETEKEILVSALDQILNGSLLFGGPSHDDNGLNDFLGSSYRREPSVANLWTWKKHIEKALTQIGVKS